MSTYLMIETGDSRSAVESLKSAGHNVLFASSGEDALRICEEIMFDAVVCTVSGDTPLKEDSWNALWKIHDYMPTLKILIYDGEGKFLTLGVGNKSFHII